MKLDNYELELLEAIEKADNFEKIEHYEEALMEAQMAAKNYLTKTKKHQYTVSNDFIIIDSSICDAKGFIALRKLKV